MGAMNAIRAAGLRIPQDIAVIGFDNIPAAELVSPALTTVTQFQTGTPLTIGTADDFAGVGRTWLGALAAFLKERIAPYKIPASFEFVAG